MSFEKKLVVGFAVMGLLVGITHGIAGAIAGAFVMGTIAAIGNWIFS